MGHVIRPESAALVITIKVGERMISFPVDPVGGATISMKHCTYGAIEAEKEYEIAVTLKGATMGKKQVKHNK